MSAWIRAGPSADLSEAAAVHADIDALEPAIDASSCWKAVVLVGLLVRLRELTDLVHDIMALRRQIRAEEPRLAKLTFAQGETIHTLQHRDHVMALHSALAATLAIGLTSAFWIASAWPEGGGAASLAAIACAFFAATQLALSSSYNADFPTYINGSAAAIVGLAATAIAISIVRSVSAEWTAWRLRRRNRVEVANIAANRRAATLNVFAALMLDRLSLVGPRLAFGAEGADGAATSALADVRVGVNIIGLQRDAVHLPEQLRRAVRTMLDGIATHYRRRNLNQADPALPRIIDGVIAAAVQGPATISRELLLQLSGIRRGLFPNAPPYGREVQDT